MNPKRAYQCDRCETVHGSELYAEECCRPEIIDGYICANCEEFHEQEKDALHCCGNTANTKCPTCLRPAEFIKDAEQIELTGTCSTCSPILSLDTRYQVDQLHEQRRIEAERF